MAITDKNIVITPNIGAASDPKIVFSGADASTAAQNITLTAYPTNGGTLSFDGSTGQLFSVTNNMTGTIFSANDVSGIPSIEVIDTGLVKIAQYSGNLLLGSGTDTGLAKLQVTGAISSTGSISAAGSTLTGKVLISGDLWAGGTNGALTIRGAYPSMVYRSTTSNSVWLIHNDGSGNHIWYSVADGNADSQAWTARMQLTVPGVLTIGGNAALHAGNYNSYSPTLGGTGASGTWGINITGNAGSTPLVSALDRDRTLAATLPTTFPQQVRFDFTQASATNSAGNYSGTMTFSPYVGTTASTGGGSYQLAFGNTAAGVSGLPQLSLRTGIDSTWNAWYTLVHSGNVSSYALTAEADTLATVTGRGASTTTASTFSGGLTTTAISGATLSLTSVDAATAGLLSIKAGNSSTTGSAGGEARLYGGNGGATGIGGAISIRSGNGGSTSGASGAINIQSYSILTGSGASGDVEIKSGEPSLGASGAVTLRTGSANTVGLLSITGGTSYAATVGGVVAIAAGAGGTSSFAGGSLTIKGGTGGTPNGTGGNVSIDAGAKTGTGNHGALSLGTSNTRYIDIASTGVLTTVYGDLTSRGKIVASQEGFQSATFNLGRNRMWSFGNADGYGISYFQGTGGYNGADSIGIHNGTATPAGCQFTFASTGNFIATGTLAGSNFSGSSSGTNTGDQTNITGNAGTATLLNSSHLIARVGSSGNWNTDFTNTAAGNTRLNGDIADTTNNPGNTWWFMQNMRHTNDSNIWGTQVAWGWEDNANRLAQRNVTTGTWSSWVYYLNSSNYSSYAVPLSGGVSITGNLTFNQPSGLYFANGQYIKDNGGGGLIVSSYNAINLTGTTIAVTGAITASSTITATGAISASNLNPEVTQTDFNLTKSPGLYHYDGAITNSPDSDANYRSIEIGAGNRYSQLVFNYSNSGLWLRRRTDTTWSGWNKIIHDGNYNSYAPTLSGAGASGTWSINIDGHAASLYIGNSGTKYMGDGQWAGTSGYPGYSFAGAGSSRFGFSAAGGVVDVYADGNFYATDSAYLVLHTSNYNSYAPTLTGTGASGTWGITAANVSSISSAVGNAYIWTNQNQFQSNLGTTSGTLNTPPLQVYATGTNAAFMSFHRAGSYAVNVGLDSDNILRIGGWSASANRLQMDMSGNLTMAGNVTAYSDERLKKDWDLLPIDFVKNLALVKVGTFTRIDSNERQVGVSAQSLITFLPEAVQDDGEYLSVAYGNAALASAVELAKEVVSLNERIARLEALVSQLIEG